MTREELQQLLELLEKARRTNSLEVSIFKKGEQPKTFDVSNVIDRTNRIDLEVAID